MKLQRYDIWAAYDGELEVAEDGEGQWARYSDLAPLLAALEKAEGALEKFVAYDDTVDQTDVDLMLAYADANRAVRAALAAIKEVRDAG